MNDKEILKLKIAVNKGRYNLLFLVIASVINLFTLSSDTPLTLPYSSAIFNYAIVFGRSGGQTLRVLSLIVACAILTTLMVCYLLSKTKPMYLVVSFSLVIADTLSLLVISLSDGSIGNLYVILDVFIHLLIIYFLLKAIKAYSLLLKEGKRLIEDESENPDENADSGYEEDDLDEDSDSEGSEYTTEENEEDLNSPIGKYVETDDEPLVKGKYNGLNIFAIIRNGKAELVINKMVCDELDVTYMSEFQLRAIVNDIDIIFDYRRSYDGETMFLYADDELLDSLGRN